MIYYKLKSNPHIKSINSINNINNITAVFKDITNNEEPYINALCNKYIIQAKQHINNELEYWDIFKKMTNPYEYIHTPYSGKSIVSKLRPLSRAYYKMIELLEEFELLQQYNKTFINTFHLAEGPGGFIEALAESRNNKSDIYHGITLTDSTNIIIPGWSKINSVLKKFPNIMIETGVSGDGDLYKYENLLYLQKKYSNTMDLITADGGFDFSIDFNKQEIYAIQLIYTQIIYALILQKKGGCFIIKIFDCFSKSMVDLIYVLTSCYDDIYITKPDTSRKANSEKYIVCKGYTPLEDIVLNKLLDIFNNIVVNGEKQRYICSIFDNKHNIHYINEIKEINTLFGQTQVENIYQTIILIKKCNQRNNSKYNIMQKKHINLCIEWCKKYNIPYNETKKRNLFLDNDI